MPDSKSLKIWKKQSGMGWKQIPNKEGKKTLSFIFLKIYRIPYLKGWMKGSKKDEFQTPNTWNLNCPGQL